MFKRPLRLRTRVTSSFLLILVLWGLLLAGSVGYLLSGAVRRFHHDLGAQAALALAAQAAPLVYYEDLTGLKSLFEDQMQSVQDVRYVVAMDHPGHPIAGSFPFGVPSDLLAVRHDTIQGSGVSTRLVRLSGESIYDYQVVKGQTVIRMGVSLSPAQMLLRRIATRASWVGLIGLLAALAMGHYVSRPLESLSAAIERAVHLDRATGGEAGFQGTEETSKIARRFQELLTRLEERTRQLDGARKLAYLGEVSATIAHEVNNPLGVLALNSELLADRVRSGELGADAAQEVSRMHAASKRATLAVQKFLQFARYNTTSRMEEVPREGRSPERPNPINIRPRPTHVQTVVQECLDLLKDKIHIARCAVHTEFPPDMPALTCDGHGLQQVLFNLLTNAVDATPEGGRVSVGTALTDGTLVLRVSDNGAGMSPEVLERAVEPFFTTKFEGLGLGLAISHSIVKANGGSLTLENGPGGGTLATVHWPVSEVET